MLPKTWSFIGNPAFIGDLAFIGMVGYYLFIQVIVGLHFCFLHLICAGVRPRWPQKEKLLWNFQK